jgi:addiction module RelE/StbE family toxin
MKIIFHRAFKKRYKRIPLKIRLQFDKRPLLFEKDSFHPLLKNHILVGNRKEERSISITGNWRAIYILKNKDTVIFIDIDTHSNLYN